MIFQRTSFKSSVQKLAQSFFNFSSLSGLRKNFQFHLLSKILRLTSGVVPIPSQKSGPTDIHETDECQPTKEELRDKKYLIECAHLIDSFISVVIIGNFKVIYYNIN